MVVTGLEASAMSVGQKKRKGEEEELTEDSRSKETRTI